MRLDEGEKLEIDVTPDEKILVTWFFTKTITYSFATMFFIFMSLFFINTMNITSEIEQISKIEKAKGDLSAKEIKEKKAEAAEKISHPFAIIIDYWMWALALVMLASIIIQIYLYYLKKTYRYIITDRRCILIGGILKRIERSVPYKKVTDIQRSQNILERMLGIWNVQIYTPGTASMQVGHARTKAEINFDGLVNSEELYEAINRNTQLAAG